MSAEAAFGLVDSSRCMHFCWRYDFCCNFCILEVLITALVEMLGGVGFLLREPADGYFFVAPSITAELVVVAHFYSWHFVEEVNDGTATSIVSIAGSS